MQLLMQSIVKNEETGLTPNVNVVGVINYAGATPNV